ncbi:MAG: cysteine peptidase family C39 domain-containing protein, partial [Sphingopyxis sp.]
MQQDLSLGTSEPPADTGLAAFAQILAMHRIVADPAELRHSLGHSDPVTASDLLRLAKRIEGVRARATTADFERLRRLPMPVMATGAEGWFVIGRVGEDAVAVQRPGAEIERWHRAELEARWSG